MSININSGTIPFETQAVNSSKKILLAGKAFTNHKAREIINPINKEEALSIYGEGDLYDAYCLLYELGVTNIYTVNCFAESDYIRLIDKLIHYDFDYFIPINIYLSDKFYNPIIDENQYYASYFLEQLNNVESLTTIIMTERHASLYEDFDHYSISMTNIENEFVNSYTLCKSNLLEQYGNNLNFIYNNLENVPFGNVILGALYCTRNYAEYLNSLQGTKTVYEIDSNDVFGLKAMYFKYNHYSNTTTIENTFNFKNTNDIYSNALIDDVIKRTIKEVDLSAFKGKLYNPYVAIQIETEAKKKLNRLKGSLFRRYEIDKITFKKTDKTSGYIVASYSIQPYGTLENINIIMGVV